MKKIRDGALMLGIFGFMCTPGCIEFDEGWIQCIAMIVIGFGIFLIINRSYSIEEDYGIHHHDDIDARPKYLRR